MRVQVLNDVDTDTLYDGPLVVLVNRQSASASEILAGALQDYERAVIVGDSKTHGKGTVQALQNLEDNNPRLGSVKITTDAFYRIAGGSTQLRGITPDIIVPSVLDELDFGEEFLPNALAWSSVDRALYEPTDNLAPLIPVLRARSEARRRANSRFAAHMELLKRLEQRQKSVDIPLGLDERLALAKTEKVLDDLQEDAERPAMQDDKKKGVDLILQEALQITSDLIAIERDLKERGTSPLLQTDRP
jgi:carboxyl-terminal processing protease